MFSYAHRVNAPIGSSAYDSMSGPNKCENEHGVGRCSCLAYDSTSALYISGNDVACDLVLGLHTVAGSSSGRSMIYF